MDLHLAQRCAIVTGGASGIGRACVDALTSEGARVVILDHDPRGAEIAATLSTQGLMSRSIAWTSRTKNR